MRHVPKEVRNTELVPPPGLSTTAEDTVIEESKEELRMSLIGSKLYSGYFLWLRDADEFEAHTSPRVCVSSFVQVCR